MLHMLHCYIKYNNDVLMGGGTVSSANGFFFFTLCAPVRLAFYCKKYVTVCNIQGAFSQVGHTMRGIGTLVSGCLVCALPVLILKCASWKQQTW